MELSDADKFCTASLFTLALHTTQVEHGVGWEPGSNPWGVPAAKEDALFQGTGSLPAGLDDSQWDAFWGFDCCGPGGLCEQVYAQLGIPEKSWEGLKRLPELLDTESPGQVLQRYRDSLDESLAALPPPAVNLPKAAPGAEAAAPPPAASAAAGDADPDLAADLQRARQRAQLQQAGHRAVHRQMDLQQAEKAAREPPIASLHNLQIASLSDEAGALQGREDVRLSDVAYHVTGKQGSPEPADKPAPPSSPSSHSEPPANPLTAAANAAAAAKAAPAAKPTPSAGPAPPADDTRPASSLAAATSSSTDMLSARGLMALSHLLEACLAKHQMPTLQDAMKVAQAKQSASVSGAAPEGAAQAASPEEASEGKPRTPNVRWYDARARVALQRLAAWLHVPWGKLAMYECLLAEQAQPPEVTEDTGKKELTFAEKRNKYLKIGAAAVGGGTLLAVTGGLAAPALAAVTGSVLAAGGGAAAAGAVTGFMGSSIGAATLIAGLGAGGGYAIGGKMAHRIGDVKEFGFREVPDDGDSKSHFSENLDAPAEPGEAQHSAAGGEQQPAQGAGRAAEHAHQDSKASSWLPWSSKKPKETEEPLLPIPVAPARPDAPRLALTIGVSGWIADKQDCITMWQHAAVADCERFGLVWETEPLIALNGALMKFIKSKATQEAGKYMVEHFLVHGLMAAVALPMTVLSASNFIDSNWAVVMDRSVKVGVLLAHVLMSGAHGDRPVTLMGYSIGARVIYHCLLELCRCNCKGIVEHAVLLGTPENLVAERWALARSVVAGRLVNGFCSTDWVLGLTFRSGSGFTQDVAGLRAVGVVGVEDVDLGAAGLISGHADYMAQMDAVLDMLGFNHA